MAHTYDELKKKNVAELREIAKDLHHDAVQGFTQMNKEHLLPALSFFSTDRVGPASITPHTAKGRPRPVPACTS